MAIAIRNQKKVHLIGIGGIGISALARYLLSEGWIVSGSDISPSDNIRGLKNEGVKVFIGHDKAHIKKDCSLVIYNQAIPEKNPELVQAKNLSIACRSYPGMVGELTKKYKTIAIAGAHGKSTTTALVSLILIEAGFDPTVIIGTKLKEFPSTGSGQAGSNFRKGNSEWLVLEADEWKASFLNYHPALAVVTNIDKEHLDFYKNFENVKKTFEKFKKQCQVVIVPNRNAKLTAEIKRVLKIPGEHNLSNALSAYSVAKYLDIPKKIIFRALSKYTGAWRRMEYRGEFKMQNAKCKIKVYDDYAHHPTEIKATLAAFREKWPKNPLICVFQAHQIQRLKLLFNDFKTAFKDADQVVILPTYEVAGREKLNRKSQIANSNLSKKLAKAIDAVYIEKPHKNLKTTLSSRITNYELPITIVMMGAGNIVDLTDTLIKNSAD